MTHLFQPCQLSDLQLKNRIVMAPMTRSRALDDGTPSKMMIDYYSQRASAGLIIAEGTYPSEDGKGYCRTPDLVERFQNDHSLSEADPASIYSPTREGYCDYPPFGR